MADMVCKTIFCGLILLFGIILEVKIFKNVKPGYGPNTLRAVIIPIVVVLSCAAAVWFEKADSFLALLAAVAGFMFGVVPGSTISVANGKGKSAPATKREDNAP